MSRHSRIEEWDDEREIGNSLIVSLKPGWAFNPSEREHVRGFDTVADAMRGVRESKPCTCEECLNA